MDCFFQWLQVYFLKKIMNLLTGALPLALLAESTMYILTEIICLFQNWAILQNNVYSTCTRWCIFIINFGVY